MNGKRAQEMRYGPDPHGNANYLSERVHREFEQAFGSVPGHNSQGHNVLPQHHPVNQYPMGDQGFNMAYNGQPVQMPFSQNNQTSFGGMQGSHGPQQHFVGSGSQGSFPPQGSFLPQGYLPTQSAFPHGDMSVHAGNQQLANQGSGQNNNTTPQCENSFNPPSTMDNLDPQDPSTDAVFPPQTRDAKMMDPAAQEFVRRVSSSNSSSSLGRKDFAVKKVEGFEPFTWEQLQQLPQLEVLEDQMAEPQDTMIDPQLYPMNSPDPNSTAGPLLEREVEDAFNPSFVPTDQGQVSPKRKLSLSETQSPPRDRSAVQNARWQHRREVLQQSTPALSPGENGTFQTWLEEGPFYHTRPQGSVSPEPLPQSQNMPYRQSLPIAPQAESQPLDGLNPEAPSLQENSQGQHSTLQSTPYPSPQQSSPESYAYQPPEGMHLCSKCGNFHRDPPPGFELVSCMLPSTEEYPDLQEAAISINQYRVQTPLPTQGCGPTTLHRFSELGQNIREKIWLYAMKNVATESAFCISGSLYGAPKNSSDEEMYSLRRANLRLKPRQSILLVNKAAQRFAQQTLQTITLNENLKIQFLPEWDTLCLSISHFQISGWDKRKDGGSMQYFLPPNQVFPQIQRLHLEITVSTELKGVFKVFANIKTSSRAAIQSMHPESARKIKAAFPNVKTVKYFCCSLPMGFEARHAIEEGWTRDVTKFYLEALRVRE